MKKLIAMWETLAMIASGLLIWAWFISRERARVTPNAQLWEGWNYLQYAAVALLLVIFVRRMIRIKRSFEDQKNQPPRF